MLLEKNFNFFKKYGNICTYVLKRNRVMGNLTYKKYHKPLDMSKQLECL